MESNQSLVDRWFVESDDVVLGDNLVGHIRQAIRGAMVTNERNIFVLHDTGGEDLTLHGVLQTFRGRQAHLQFVRMWPIPATKKCVYHFRLVTSQ